MAQVSRKRSGLCEYIQEIRSPKTVTADLHQASALKNAALKFLSKYMKELKTSEWKKKLMKYPALLAEVVESLLLINMDCDIKKRASS